MKSASQLLGLPVFSDDPLFLLALGAHIVAGLTAVVAGAVAALSPKRPGLHPRAGLLYAWGLLWVFVSSGVMAVIRWPDDIHLAIVGALTLGSGAIGYAFRIARRDGWMRFHLASMSLSYVLLLTGFYVDNGPNLPLWRNLPPIMFWFLPAVVGFPLVVRAWRRYAPQAQGAAS